VGSEWSPRSPLTCVSAGGDEGNRTPNPRLAKVEQGARLAFSAGDGGPRVSGVDRDDPDRVARLWHGLARSVVVADPSATALARPLR
jgi:hypothetical protein